MSIAAGPPESDSRKASNIQQRRHQELTTTVEHWQQDSSRDNRNIIGVNSRRETSPTVLETAGTPTVTEMSETVWTQTSYELAEIREKLVRWRKIREKNSQKSKIAFLL